MIQITNMQKKRSKKKVASNSGETLSSVITRIKSGLESKNVKFVEGRLPSNDIEHFVIKTASHETSSVLGEIMGNPPSTRIAQHPKHGDVTYSAWSVGDGILIANLRDLVYVSAPAHLM